MPIFIPALDEVRALALRLHKDAQPYQGRTWGWEPCHPSSPGRLDQDSGGWVWSVHGV